jgi:hypothetical protein
MRSFNSNAFFGGVRQTSLYVSNQETSPSDSHKETSLSQVVTTLRALHSPLSLSSQDGCRVCGELSQRCMLAMTRNLLFGKGLPPTEGDEDQSMNI